MDIIEIIGWSSIPSAIVGVITFLWKQKIVNEFEQENIKLKSELDNFVNESNVRFSQAYSIRTVAMRELYKKLVQAESDLKSFIAPIRWSTDESKETIMLRAINSAKEFKDFYLENEILFDNEICGLFGTIQKEFMSRWIDYETLESMRETLLKQDMVKIASENINKYNDTFDHTIPALKDRIKSSFRAELGIK